jgi:arylsulfatase A-like enzyme
VIHRSIRILLALIIAMAAPACQVARPRVSPTPLNPAPTAWEASPTPPATETPGIVPATSIPSPTSRPPVERVLIFSLDGLRPDALSPDLTPTILGLAERGAYTLAAQTILPSSTLPAHASMLTGFDVDGHGVTWNDYIPANGYVRSLTIFTLAHVAGYRTAMVVGKEKLVHIAVPGTVDAFVYVPGGDYAIAEAAAAQVHFGFGVLFVHLIGPDAAGHQYGWMSESYLGTVRASDEAVRRVLAAVDESGLSETTLVILTADHGGHGTTHGSARPEDTTIPWIVAGPGVIPGLVLQTPVRVLDTAPTAAWALGLARPEAMPGQPVVEAFGVGIAD